MSVSYEFQRYIPDVFANNAAMHRKKAEEWRKLKQSSVIFSMNSYIYLVVHQATVARQVMQGLHTVTGQYSTGSGDLCYRPFYVFWFMGQIGRALALWECDHSLISALEVCKNLLLPTDYLTALWPCPGA